MDELSPAAVDAIRELVERLASGDLAALAADGRIGRLTVEDLRRAMSRPVLKLGGGRGGDHYAAFARAARGTSASRRLESAASQSLATAPRSSRTCPATGRSRPLAGHAEP